MKSEILSRLSDTYPWSGHLHYFPTIGSTNDHIRTLARSGAPHGTVVIAGQEIPVMGDSQYFYTIACLAVSAVCCVVAAVISHMNNKKLAEHMKTLETQSA